MAELAAARRHYARSALLARQAVRQAQRARRQGLTAIAGAVLTMQAAAAAQAQLGVAQMLAEQGIRRTADALLDYLAYTTPGDTVTAMLGTTTTDLEFDRLVASLVQDAGRAAEQVAVATRPDVGWTRHLTPPSCSRCAVLAGRVYRYSSGFMRHPHDDCVTVAVREGDVTYAADVQSLLKTGHVTGLSKADQQALAEGADFAKVVNVRRQGAGLSVAGQTLTRAGGPTPAGILRTSRTREDALEALALAGYLI